MNELERYVVEEQVEDFNDGLISRRELLRRVTLVTGSLAATLALLEAMGCGSQPSGTASPTPTTGTAANRPYATPPGAPTSDGVTVRPDDSRLRVEPLPVKGADGAQLITYFARPAAGGPVPGVVVVHENRGLVPHIKDVVRRVATAGFAGLSIDLLSREGGADALSDPAAYMAALPKRPAADMVSDLRQGLAALSAWGSGARTGIVGFCFGGGMVWNVLASGADVRAAAPFYGPAPSPVEGLAAQKAAVYAVYAELDTRITSQRGAVEEQLKKSGRPYEITVRSGVDHAFHNDTGPRYNAPEAQKAWAGTVEWFNGHLR